MLTLEHCPAISIYSIISVFIVFCLLENVIKIADKYLTDFEPDGDGSLNQMIVDRKYTSVLQIDANQHLLVANSIANHAKDMTLADIG